MEDTTSETGQRIRNMGLGSNDGAQAQNGKEIRMKVYGRTAIGMDGASISGLLETCNSTFYLNKS